MCKKNCSSSLFFACALVFLLLSSQKRIYVCVLHTQFTWRVVFLNKQTFLSSSGFFWCPHTTTYTENLFFHISSHVCIHCIHSSKSRIREFKKRTSSHRNSQISEISERLRNLWGKSSLIQLWLVGTLLPWNWKKLEQDTCIFGLKSDKAQAHMRTSMSTTYSCRLARGIAFNQKIWERLWD